jgi:hypothetical protein
LKRIRLNGQGGNPFTLECVDELKLFIRHSLGLCLSQIQRSPDGLTVCSALQSTRGPLLQKMESEAALRVDAEYSQFLAEFEVDREAALVEWRKTLAGGEPPAAMSGENNPSTANPPPTPATTNSEATGVHPRSTEAGHVTFLECVRDEVRGAAEAKRRQAENHYSNDTLASMVGGIRWAEAGRRLALLRGLPPDAVE